jgi:hypothetical protein
VVAWLVEVQKQGSQLSQQVNKQCMNTSSLMTASSRTKKCLLATSLGVDRHDFLWARLSTLTM